MSRNYIMPQRSRIFIGRFVLLMIMCFAFFNSSTAQKNRQIATITSVQNRNVEVFLTIQDDAAIDVYIDGVRKEVAVDSTSNVCPGRPYDWAISNEGTHPDNQVCPGGADTLNTDQKYEFEFRVLEGGSTFTYTYFQCFTGYSSVFLGDFFCPNVGTTDYQDLHFLYKDGDMKVDAESSQLDTLNTYFTDSNWLLPHHVYDASGNENDVGEVGYFVTPQSISDSSPSFVLTNDDFVIPAASAFARPQDVTWLWDDPMTLKFQTGTKFIVNDTLVAEDVTLTSSGSNWGGVEFKDGSKVTFTEVDILNVGTGAHTGTMTIRDGADVTLIGDNIVLGPSFIAEEGGVFLATHDAGAASAPDGPRPILDEEVYAPVAEKVSQKSEKDIISVETYPNPFNPVATLRYRLKEGAFVTLKVYNLLGKEVRSLVSEFQDPGSWEFSWDGRDLSGAVVPSGSYLYKITAGSQTETGMMVLVK